MCMCVCVCGGGGYLFEVLRVLGDSGKVLVFQV